MGGPRGFSLELLAPGKKQQADGRAFTIYRLTRLFEFGREYRRQQLLVAVGSRQQQSGVIWGKLRPDIVIVTSGGRNSKRAGYSDKQNADGSWEYFGQGETGDQNQGSPGNRLLIDGQRTILLFSTREPTSQEAKAQGSYAKLYKYEGMFLVSSWEYFTPTIGKRKGNRLLHFHLVPVYPSFMPELGEDSSYFRTGEVSFSKLRATLVARNGSAVIGQVAATEFRKGSAQTRVYARLRAAGSCENCDMPAPFVDKSGQPFLEVHHIDRLADDGPDLPTNVAAICPNCHREAHYSSDPSQFRERLKKRVLEKERCLEFS